MGLSRLVGDKLTSRLRFSILFLLAPAAAAADHAGPTTHLRIQVVPPPITQVDATLALISRDEAAGSEQVRHSRPIRIPAEIEIEPLESSAVTIRIEGEGLWAPETSLPRGARKPAVVQVFQTRSVHLEIAAAGDEEAPEIVEAAFSSLPGQTGVPRNSKLAGNVACPVEAQRALCDLPRLNLDLKLSCPGFAPVYLWEVDLRIGPSDEIPTRALKVPLIRGASIAGYVVDEEGEPQPAAEVALQVPRAKNTSRPSERLELLSERTTTNERGFFQLSGLPPGTYAVVAAKAGFSPSPFPSPITVRGDLEERLSEPLVIERPGIFELAIEPGSDPTGKPWGVQLVPTSPRSGGRVALEMSTLGVWRRADLDPGTYLLLVTASDGSRWFGEPLEVEPGDQRRQIEIPVVSIVGTVRRGSEPEAGRLILIKRENGSEVKLWLDDDGRFSGVLPGHGRWDGRLEGAGSNRTILALKPIFIDPPEGAQPTEIDIEIADTLVEGHVVDSSDEPVPGSQVLVIENDKLTNTEGGVDPEGAFRFSGLDPGRLTIYAHHPDGRASDFLILDLQEDLDPGPLRLELLESTAIEGQVLSHDGHPLPGTALTIWQISEIGTLSQARPLLAGVDGAFRATIPKVSAVRLLVRAPGFGTRFLQQDLPPAGPWIVQLPQEHGRLQLTLPPTDDGGGIPSSLFLAQDGTALHLSSLLRFVESVDLGSGEQGRLVEIPGMAAGQYRLCTAGSLTATASYRTVDLLPDSLCHTGFLAAEGILELRPPSRSQWTDLRPHSN